MKPPGKQASHRRQKTNSVNVTQGETLNSHSAPVIQLVSEGNIETMVLTH